MRCARASFRAPCCSVAADEVLADGRDATTALSVDPFSDQATRLVDLRVAPISETRDSAKVEAQFGRADGARERLTYALVLEHGEWRVDDIEYATLDGQRHTLRDLLAAN